MGKKLLGFVKGDVGPVGPKGNPGSIENLDEEISKNETIENLISDVEDIKDVLSGLTNPIKKYTHEQTINISAASSNGFDLYLSGWDIPKDNVIAVNAYVRKASSYSTWVVPLVVRFRGDYKVHVRNLCDTSFTGVVISVDILYFQ